MAVLITRKAVELFAENKPHCRPDVAAHQRRPHHKQLVRPGCTTLRQDRQSFSLHQSATDAPDSQRSLEGFGRPGRRQVRQIF